MTDAYRSAQFKRGVVVLNDYENARSRVRMEDEDGTNTFWLSWNMGSAGTSKIYSAPDVNSQVNVLLDRHGEDGIILGARYSKQDRPPTMDGKLVKALMEGGADITYNKANGALTLNLPGGMKVIGNVDFQGGHVKHEGVFIDKTHGHVTAPDGPPGPPVGA